MSDVLELKKTVKQLQSAINDQEIIGILSPLKQKNVTEAILRESKIGLAVGKLRTHKSKPVSDLAKEIVKHWKTAVEKAKLKAGGNTPTGGGHEKPVVANAGTPVSAGGAASGLRTAKGDSVKAALGDATRDKCVEMIYDAIACDATAPIELVLEKAKGIEHAVFKANGSTNAAYKSKIRSLFVNLKDKSNPGLRASIVEGSLAPDKLAQMSSPDMASEERKAADQKIKEENLFKSLSAAEKQAETDAFQCSRCKQRKCIYRQQQTRSADEPMTTFVTCTVCQNKWKFS